MFTLLSFVTSPASPLVLFLDVPALEAHETLLASIHFFALVETVWWVVHSVARRLIALGFWDLRVNDGVEQIGTEERWRIWKAMLESDQDPSEWLLAMFTKPGGSPRAAEGMRDPAVRGFSLQEVGRPNVEEVRFGVKTTIGWMLTLLPVPQYVAHYLFGRSLGDVKRDSLDKGACLQLAQL